VTTQIRKEAAVKIRKLKVGKVPWSPTLQAVRDSQKLWTLVIRHRERKKVSRNLLKRTMKKCHMISIENISLEQAKANQKVAHAAYLKEVRRAPDTQKKASGIPGKSTSSGERHQEIVRAKKLTPTRKTKEPSKANPKNERQIQVREIDNHVQNMRNRRGSS